MQLKHDFEQQQVLSRADLRLMGIRVSNSTLLRWEAQSRFPRRIRMAGTTVGWISGELSQWLQDRAAERAQHHYADFDR